MTGPGIYSYSTTPASNVQANTGFTMDEGMAPASLNNSIRQIMTDIRNQHNDLIWFRYGKGDLDYSPVYVASTQFKVAGADVTTVYHVGRRVKVVGSSTGTIYGTISVSSFSTDTTLTCVFDSGSLSNETLTVYLAQVPVTGAPVHANSIKGTSTNDSPTAGRLGELLTGQSGGTVALTTATAKTVTSVSLTPGDWLVSGIVVYNGQTTTVPTDAIAGISTTTNTLPSSSSSANNMNRQDLMVPGRAMNGSFTSNNVGPYRISLSATTTYYLVGYFVFSAGTAEAYGTIQAQRIR